MTNYCTKVRQSAASPATVLQQCIGLLVMGPFLSDEEAMIKMSLRNPIQEQYICKGDAKQEYVPVEKQKSIYFYLGCLWPCSCTPETNGVMLGLFALPICF